MNKLNFETGYKEYCINDDESKILRIKTNDMNILSRMNKAEQELKKVADICYNISKTDDSNKIIETLTDLDNKVREQIDYIFDGEVSSIIFGNTNCISIANGKPIFENFLDAVLPIIKNDFVKEQMKLENKIGKYTSKIK